MFQYENSPDCLGSISISGVSSITTLDFGGSFILADKYPSVTVLAQYSPEPPHTLKSEAAIIECIVGDGKAILSGPHFEWDPATFDPGSKQLMDIQPILTSENSNRLVLAKHLLERLEITSTNTVNTG